MRIVSGGQTGVDRAALDAAMEAGFDVGGWCPRGRLAEDGRLSDHYPLLETASSVYAERTERNVVDSDATLIVTLSEPSGGTALTIRFAQRHRRPFLVVRPDDPQASDTVLKWLREWNVGVLNVAGPRESGSPGVYAEARDLVKRVLERI